MTDELAQCAACGATPVRFVINPENVATYDPVQQLALLDDDAYVITSTTARRFTNGQQAWQAMLVSGGLGNRMNGAPAIVSMGGVLHLAARREWGVSIIENIVAYATLSPQGGAPSWIRIDRSSSSSGARLALAVSTSSIAIIYPDDPAVGMYRLRLATRGSAAGAAWTLGSYLTVSYPGYQMAAYDAGGALHALYAFSAQAPGSTNYWFGLDHRIWDGAVARLVPASPTLFLGEPLLDPSGGLHATIAYEDGTTGGLVYRLLGFPNGGVSPSSTEDLPLVFALQYNRQGQLVGTASTGTELHLARRVAAGSWESVPTPIASGNEIYGGSIADDSLGRYHVVYFVIDPDTGDEHGYYTLACPPWLPSP
jgi:hypothetical protein